MPKKYIDFLIVPQGKPKSFKFKLSYFATWVILGLIALLLAFVVGFSILQGQLLYQVLAGKSLKQENEKLKRYNARVVELEKELKEYESFVQRVAELAGIEYKGKKRDQLAYHPDKMEPKDTLLIAQSKASEGSVSVVNHTIRDSDRKEERRVSFQEADLIPPEIEIVSQGSDSLAHMPMGSPIAGWATKGFSVNTPQLGGDHPGVDFAAKTGTKVKATAAGEVIFSGWDDTYGNLVGIDHGNGYVTYYGHNLKNLVNVGDVVHRGDVIALSGSSGRSSAPHLHYEIKKDGVPIDPKDFLNQHQTSPSISPSP